MDLNYVMLGFNIGIFILFLKHNNPKVILKYPNMHCK